MSELPRSETRPNNRPPQNTGDGKKPGVSSDLMKGESPEGMHATDRQRVDNQQGIKPEQPRSTHAGPVPARSTVPMNGNSSEPTLGALFSSLSDDFTLLLRQEVALATAEIQQSAGRALRAGVMVTLAGFLGYAGLILMLIAAAILLGDALESLWLGTAIVGLVVIVIAAILFVSGKSKLEDVNFVPRRAIKSVERDIEMTKEKLS